ncbi:MAG: hypothetical protein LBC82_03570 [Oscillospiraceae bacterium]|nr:hypothetical protein [Oscillospiraceae bacterium]
MTSKIPPYTTIIQYFFDFVNIITDRSYFVFDEVLPTIRKHGTYITDELLKRLADKTDEADALLSALSKERRKVREERQSREFIETFATALVPKAR